ncbi:MAG TPA: SdpI family protein [Nitrospirota bacterium]|nr:SdpI family protein [Nitrospirota bacterium]
MDHESLMFGLTNVFVGILVIALCLPLLKNKIGMNYFYGVRFRKSFKPDENWYKINRFGARRMIIWSVVIIIIGMLSLIIPVGARKSLHPLLARSPLIFIIPTIESWLFAKRLW